MYEHIRTYIQDVHKAEMVPSHIYLTCVTNVCQISEVDRAMSPPNYGEERVGPTRI